ncbi:MAG: uracil-DNA glycosylase [Pirellulaceae bacterium]|jgi:DNA polymerase|nr:uracil-DNA glycosylase [Pirellulaceae bacterium]MDP7016887.1 uracil-DNA glycosylase [Pirellulaceae bacterium]
MRADDAGDPTVRRLVLQHLETLERAGVERIDRRAALPSPSAPAADPAKIERPQRDAVQHTADDAKPPTHPAVDAQIAELAALADEVRNCTLCQDLAKSRTQTVFGVGNPNPRLCFFGEAPGADEDRQGEPFVGAAGQLLNRIIQAMTLSREDVYILNVLKCRPPGNRNPKPDEISSCRPFFERQLEILDPDFICCLGGYAAKTLLNTEDSVGRLRGRLHDFRGIQVVVTYHPAYLLRAPEAKRKTWDDIQLLMREMGIS